MSPIFRAQLQAHSRPHCLLQPDWYGMGKGKGQGQTVSYLRWSTHCTTRPKVPSPRVLTISSEMRQQGGGEGRRERGNELRWKEQGYHNLG